MSYRVDRRTFLKHAAYAGAVMPVAAPRLVRAESANEKLNIAFVGSQGKASTHFDELADHNVVAIADVDASFLARRVESLASDDDASQKPATYRDYRRMLDKEQRNIDAVVIATPDHHHAIPALQAMAMGKHVYCEKPLAHTAYECRLMIEAAKRYGVATQMGNQIHSGDNYRRVVEAIESKVIGEVREVHVFLYGANYMGSRFPDSPDEVPDHLDWDLWLGPAEERDYYDNLYHRFNWRGWWDFGGGGLSDFGCHYVDLPHWALGLDRARTARAFGRDPMPLRTSPALMVEFHYPAEGDRDELKLTWHHGGTHIDKIDIFEKYGFTNEQWRGNGVLFVGEEGLLVANYGDYKLLPEEKFADYEPPEPYIPSSPGQQAEWVNACKGGEPALCRFEYGGALTESVLLGVASHRAGNVEVEYDAENLRITNNDEADAFLTKSYRKGWDVDEWV